MPEFAKPDLKWLAFECARCQRCCLVSGYVYLEREEPLQIARFLGLTEFDFVNDFCELQARQTLVLKKSENEVCVFLSGEGCAIYPSRPKQCREFPVKWRTELSYEYCEGIKKLQQSTDAGRAFMKQGG